METILQTELLNIWLMAKTIFIVSCYTGLIVFVVAFGVKELLWRK